MNHFDVYVWQTAVTCNNHYIKQFIFKFVLSVLNMSNLIRAKPLFVAINIYFPENAVILFCRLIMKIVQN